MKVLTLISKRDKKRFAIRKDKTGLIINKPIYLKVNFDSRFHIKKYRVGFVIRNNKCSVYFWDFNSELHIIIF